MILTRARAAQSRCLLLSVFVLVLCLSGCGASGTQGSSTLRIWYSTDDPTERAWSQDLLRGFQRSYPNVRVRLTAFDFEDLNTKLQLALSSGNPPDVAYVTPRGPGIPAYLGAGQLTNLSTAARTRGWATALRPGLLAAYNRPFRFYAAKAPGVTAVPTALAAVGVLYNQRLLKHLHLSVPDSFAAMQQAMARAKTAGYIPLGMGNADGWLGDEWYLTLVNALVSPASLKAEQRLDPHFSFQAPQYLQAARLLRTWAARGYFTPDFGGLDAQEGIDQFFHGKTLFTLISSSQNSQILADGRETGLSVGVFAFPQQNGGTVMPQSGYLGWVVPKEARHKALAIDFIDSLMRPSTALLLERHGVLPAHTLQRRSGAGVARSVSATGFRAGWQRQYLAALNTAQPGIYLDAAPIANLNATMEANVQLLLQGYEAPEFLVTSLQEVYASHGRKGSTARIDGEF
jgi:raffinose/stachyose/melibiose transport system substrate-binding protein